MQRDPVDDLPSDVRLLKFIRRANLDAIWSSEPKTVASTLSEARRGLGIAQSFGFRSSLFPSLGPFPLSDSFGMGAAIVMLQLSLAPGKNDTNVQFGTIRQFRASYSNIFQASVKGQDAAVLAHGTKKLFVTKCPSYGIWFSKFSHGCHRRMGDISKPDRALSIEILVEIMKDLELEWVTLRSDIDRWHLALEGAFYLIGFCCALRGEEIPLVDIHGTHQHLASSLQHASPHTIVTLLGRFKNRTGDGNYYLLPIANVTFSGLEPRRWIERAISWCHRLGHYHGSLFFDIISGTRFKQSAFEVDFIRRICVVQDRRPDLIGAGVNVEDEYGISRSIRRGATSRATDLGLPPHVINANCRWRAEETAGATNPSLTMHDHYTDVRLTINLQLQFSAAL